MPADGAPTTLVLVRHGETELTAQKRFSGSGGRDPSLSARGRAQAERVAAALAGAGSAGAGAGGGPDAGTGAGVGFGAGRGAVEVVVSSPLARCRETAETVVRRLGLPPVHVEPDLRETDFGAFEGLTFAEVRDRYPAALDAWLASPSAGPPDGESFDDVAHRVAAARSALLTRFPGRTLLLVSHVTPIKTLLRLALAAPPEALFRFDVAPASLSALSHYPDGNTSVHYLNHTHHLP